MQLIFLLLFCVLINSSIARSEKEIEKERVIKNKGRLSRVTWQLHENENDNLNHRMFEDENRESDRPHNKIHYTKRKYNVKVEHKRKNKPIETTTKKDVTISRKKEILIGATKYSHNPEKPHHYPQKMLSRVTWQLHEHENDNLNHRLFEDEDGEFDRLHNFHHSERKYNIKVEHTRKDKPIDTTTEKGVTILIKKEILIGLSKYHHSPEKSQHYPQKIPNKNQIDQKMSKSNLGQKISIGITDIKRTFKSVPNVKERNKFYSRNSIETDRFHEELKKDTKVKSKKKNAQKSLVLSKRAQPQQVGFAKPPKTTLTEKKIDKDLDSETVRHSKISSTSQLLRKPKTIYIRNKEHEHTKMRRDPKVQMLTLPDPTKNIHRKSIRDKKSEKNLLPLMGLNADSLANPPKQTKAVKVHEDDNTSLADELAKKVRILCWVMTHPVNHNKTCKPIKDTWGRRCTKLLFMSTDYDPEIPTIKLNVQEGRGFLWPKVKAAFQYVYDNYRNQYDWFVRADDDTFMVVENLRYLLADFNPKEPLYFGCRFKHFAPQGFMSGGAGVAISNAALNKLIPALKHSDICKINLEWNWESEDVNLGVCLNRVGVKAMDSRDVAHKGRFLVFMPQTHLSPNKISKDKSFWYWKYVYYPTETGVGCCSDYAVSFHYVSPDDMYALEYLIYRVRPFGIQHGDGPIPSLLRSNPDHITDNQMQINQRAKDDTYEDISYTTSGTTIYYDYTTNYDVFRKALGLEDENVKPTRIVYSNRETERTTIETLTSEASENHQGIAANEATATNEATAENEATAAIVFTNDKRDAKDATTPANIIEITSTESHSDADFTTRIVFSNNAAPDELEEQVTDAEVSSKKQEMNSTDDETPKRKRKTSSYIRRMLKKLNDISL